MHFFTSTLGLLLLISSYAVANPEVAIPEQSITYHGTSKDGVEQFQNIRYAQDTSGQNRFAPPQPYAPPPGPIDATRPGAACPQALNAATFYSSPVTNISEDCLTLRVARPATNSTDARRLPVLFWIYGGGSTTGQIYDATFEPAPLVQQSVTNGQPVIYVAANYRLGIFGTADTPFLRRNQSSMALMRDQRAALEWVHENIAFFGGDPDHVTVFGQSAGGTYVGYQMLAYGGAEPPLFQHAFMMSGTPGTEFGIDTGRGANATAEVARAVNCTQDVASDEFVQCLRDTPFDVLNAAQLELIQSSRVSFGPYVDGDILPDRPSVLIQNGRFAKNITILTSWTYNDGSLFPPANTSTSASIAPFLQTFWPQLTLPSINRLLDLYPADQFTAEVTPADPANVQFYRAARIFRDVAYTCQALHFTRYNQKWSTAKNWLYQLNQTVFDTVLPASDEVSHVSDVPYVFDDVTAQPGWNGSEANVRLARAFSSSVIAYATTGDPNGVPEGTEGLTRDWPTADDGATDADVEDRFSALLAGGPYGTQSVRCAANDTCEGEGGSVVVSAVAEDLERLFARCKVVEGLFGELEGVPRM